MSFSKIISRIFLHFYNGRHILLDCISSVASSKNGLKTTNDHLKNLGFKGKQDAHGFRHVVTNALVDIKQKDEKMVSRCLSHLFKEGSIGNYDYAERLKQRREIHECWNSLLVNEGGLKI